MSNMSAGQIIGGVVGAVAGYFVGNPMLGFTLGSALGGAIDPPQLPGAEGPRIEEGPDLQATVGRAIPITFGAVPVSGIDIWVARYPDGRRYVEHANSETLGGKGGPEQDLQTYSYTTSYAKVFGEGQKAALLILRRNGEIVYDIRGRQPNETTTDFHTRLVMSAGYAAKIEIYLGTDSQLPSPTIEASEGVGNVPAYRGRHYIVWVDDDVTDTRTLPPQIDATWADAVTPDSVTDIMRTSSVIYPWAGSTFDPRNCRNDHEYSYNNISWRPTLAEAIQDAPEAARLNYEYLIGYISTSPSPSASGIDRRTMRSLGGLPPGERTYLSLKLNRHRLPEKQFARSPQGVGGGGNALIAKSLTNDGAYQDPFYWTGSDSLGEPNGAFEPGVYICTTRIERASPVPPNPPPPAGYGGAWKFTIRTIPGSSPLMYEVGFLWKRPDTSIYVRRKERAPDAPCSPRCIKAPPLLPENEAYCVIGSSIVSTSGYVAVTGTCRWLARAGVYGAGDPSNNQLRPRGPVLLPADPRYSDATFWQQAYGEAVAAGDLPAGMTYNAGGGGGVLTYPRNNTMYYQKSDTLPWANPLPVSLSAIVTRLCLRSGLAAEDIDVSDIAPINVYGYRIANATTARACIEQLRMVGIFDVIDADVLSFSVRGKAAVRTFSDSELGAHYSGEPMPPRLLPERTEDVELPRSIRINYLSVESLYTPALQQDQRIVTRSEQLIDLSLPVVLSDDRAAQLSQIWLVDAHVARERYTTAIGPRDLALLPGDAVILPLDGEPVRARIIERRMGLPGVISLTLLRDDASAYLSSRVGVPSAGADNSIRPTPGPTQLLVLDGPALTEQSNDAGFHVGVIRVLRGWRGASLMLSRDQGATWVEQMRVSQACVAGSTAGALPYGSPHIPDDVNVLTVVLPEGAALYSATELEVLNGANTAFVGRSGRWELVGFRTATQIDATRWQLRNLIRGRRGTEINCGNHEDGDVFVLNGAGVYRIQLPEDVIGQNLQLRAVSFGTAIDTAADAEATPTGAALECYAPCQISGVRIGGDILISWLRRTRVSGEWRDLVDVPLNEQDERYEIEIIKDGFGPVRTLNATGPAVTYTAAQISADFGTAPSSIAVRVYQMSAIVGRGYPGDGRV